ncbi:hypothetical protein [Sorangium sp. So ce1000]|uniref:hypothetical protein n=1 Tax=Sorangium sp. So ce1000 TaxID=3133325 RepID=UPI003F633DC1
MGAHEQRLGRCWAQAADVALGLARGAAPGRGAKGPRELGPGRSLHLRFAPVVGEFFKRLTNGVVFLLAALTFFLVPIGRKTAAQHLVAIVSTPPAQEAASAFAHIARRIATEARTELDKLRNPQPAQREPKASTAKVRPPP